MTHAKQSPLSYADSSHSHLCTPITSWFCCWLCHHYVQNIVVVVFPLNRGSLYSMQKWYMQMSENIGASLLSLSVTVNCCRPVAPENGVSVCPAAFQWPAICSDHQRKSPCFRKCKYTTPRIHTNYSYTHMIQLNTHTQYHQNKTQTDKWTQKHAYTVVTVAQSDRLCTMVPFEWGQTMELFGIWIEPDDEYPRRLNRRLQPPTQPLFWPWKYASVCCLLPRLKISVISMKAAAL